jgi:hypothetical protein
VQAFDEASLFADGPLDLAIGTVCDSQMWRPSVLLRRAVLSRELTLGKEFGFLRVVLCRRSGCRPRWLCRELTSADGSSRHRLTLPGPTKRPRQSLIRSAKPEFPVVFTWVKTSQSAFTGSTPYINLKQLRIAVLLMRSLCM